jgi:hypothetical protein
MAKYTYSIFDSNPNASSVDAWPDHDDVEIECDSDDEAESEVQDILDSAANECSPSDGYEVGQSLYALITDVNSAINIAVLTHEITAEELGIEETPESKFSKDEVERMIEDLSFITPPEMQGQIVEASFACDADYIFCRVFDRSDRSTRIDIYEHPDDAKEGDFEPWNREPATGTEVASVEI